MSETFTAFLKWQRRTVDFTYENYQREHSVTLGSGSNLNLTAAPAYKGDPKIANPEELFLAALSSCHMLTFLAICAWKRLVVDSYEDAATAILTKNESAKLSVTEASLNPKVKFADPSVDQKTVEAIHKTAHENCFIAQSVKTKITINTAF